MLQSRGEVIYDSSDLPGLGNSESKSGQNVDLSSYQDSLIHQNAPLRMHHDDIAFNGKLFGVGQTEYSLADSIERRVESPLQRYSRLKMELEQLKFDLDGVVVAESQQSASIYSLLQHETNALVTATRALEGHKGLELLKRTISTSDKVLEQLVDSVKTITVRENPFDIEKAKNRSGVFGDLSLVALERRVATLEALLGLSSNVLDLEASSGKPFSTSFPLIDAVSKMEQRLSMLDSSNLDSLRSKTSNLRAELEAAAKAKGSLALESKALESAQKVDDLVEKVTKIEAVSNELPLIAVRLKTLDHVHKTACTFAHRLESLEADVSTLNADLKSNKDVLSALKEGMAENISIMQKNLRQMDLKVSALENLQ
eukprot:gene32556-42172_t